MSDLLKVIEDNILLGKTITFRRFGQDAVIEVKRDDYTKDIDEHTQLLPLEDHFDEDRISKVIRMLALKADGFE